MTAIVSVYHYTFIDVNYMLIGGIVLGCGLILLLRNAVMSIMTFCRRDK